MYRVAGAFNRITDTHFDILKYTFISIISYHFKSNYNYITHYRMAVIMGRMQVKLHTLQIQEKNSITVLHFQNGFSFR